MDYSRIAAEIMHAITMTIFYAIFLFGSVGLFAWIYNHIASWAIAKVQHALRITEVIASAIFYVTKYKPNRNEFADFHEWRTQKKKEANHGT